MPNDLNLDDLRRAYDAKAGDRAASRIEPWKDAERDQFLLRLTSAGAMTLLDLGSGPGVHASWFAAKGLKVTCIDLSPEHIRFCRELGLEAEVMPFLSLEFPGRRFDAAFAMNSLLHVPQADLPAVLRRIHSVLAPGSFFFLGQYGGKDREGVLENDNYVPKRFFVSWDDDRLQATAIEAGFELQDFHRVALTNAGTLHYQSMTLKRRD